MPSLANQPLFRPLFWTCVMGLLGDFFFLGLFMGIAGGAPLVGVLMGILAARLSLRHPAPQGVTRATWTKRIASITGGVAALGQLVLSGVVILLMVLQPGEWSRRISSEPSLGFLSLLPHALDRVGIFMVVQTLVFAALEFLLSLGASHVWVRVRSREGSLGRAVSSS